LQSSLKTHRSLEEFSTVRGEGQRAKGQREGIRRAVSFKECFLKPYPATSVHLSSLVHP